MNILFPIGGKGSRLDTFSTVPKPLIKIFGKSILEWSIQTLNLDGNYIFCIKKEHQDKFKIIEELKRIKPSCDIITIDYQTQGALETILHARQLIDNNEDLLISDADHFLDWNGQGFLKKIKSQNIDGCAMIFPEPKKMGNIEIDTKTGEKTVLEDTMDWCWAVVKAIPIPEEDRERYPDPTNPGTFYKNKMDMKNIKRYNKLEFMDAAEELGMFNPTLVGEIEVSEESSKKIGSEGPSPSESSEK